MLAQWFTDPVTVDTDKGARCRVVRDTLHAAEILLRRWPLASRGREHGAAVGACLDAMNGRQDVGIARRAFVAAAKKARIFVQSGRLHPMQPDI
jgi:hypothetical protein